MLLWTHKLRVALLSLAVLPAPALAWDVVAAGHVSSLYFGNPTSAYNLQVRLDATAPTCGTNLVFFITASDSNYTVYTSGLMSAYLSGKSVRLYTIKDAAGHCKIGDFEVF
jgi:hypothetical protein